ncbi:hypothetical protein [Gordonia caeni]|uniref:hypothetical protein n=1 Tax=Gordonia caeni TaxID=1007097 RepID=UPI0031E33D09
MNDDLTHWWRRYEDPETLTPPLGVWNRALDHAFDLGAHVDSDLYLPPGPDVHSVEIADLPEADDLPHDHLDPLSGLDDDPGSGLESEPVADDPPDGEQTADGGDIEL